MNDTPLITFVGLMLAETLAEYFAMLRTGTLRRKQKWEWTYYAVAFPFKAMVGAAVAEHIAIHTRPTVLMVVAGSLLAAAGIAIRVQCHFELAGAFSQYVEKSEGHRLVQSGMYARSGIRCTLAAFSCSLVCRWRWPPSRLGCSQPWVWRALGSGYTKKRPS